MYHLAFHRSLNHLFFGKAVCNLIKLILNLGEVLVEIQSPHADSIATQPVRNIRLVLFVSSGIEKHPGNTMAICSLVLHIGKYLIKQYEVTSDLQGRGFGNTMV